MKLRLSDVSPSFRFRCQPHFCEIYVYSTQSATALCDRSMLMIILAFRDADMV